MSSEPEPSPLLTCPACGQAITAVDEFCTHCWEPLHADRLDHDQTSTQQDTPSPSRTIEGDSTGDSASSGNTLSDEVPIEAMRASETPVSSSAADEGDSIVDATISHDDDSIADAEVLPEESMPVARSPFAPQNRPLSPRSLEQAAPHQPLENMAARGGAVGAMTLGVMAIPGALLTSASAITALLGIGLGTWGLLSKYRRSAIIGMGLCIVALLISLLREPLGLSRWF